MLATTLRELSGLPELLPPVTDAELQRLESSLPCPIPDDVRAAMRLSRGFAGGPLESFSLVDLEGFGLEEAFPYAYSIAHDGFGNYWVLDLLPDTTVWGPVLYACHDPPVIAYQAATIEEFLRAVAARGPGGARSPVDVVREDVVHRIWRENPGLKSPSALRDSADPLLRELASTLSAEAFVADLRAPSLGDGFNWGRFGPRTVIHRAGTERVWTLTPPERRPGFLARLFGGSEGGA